MSSLVSVTRFNKDDYLTNLSASIQKRLDENNRKKGKISYAFVWKTLSTIISWKQYNASHNYITCMWNMLYSFPNIMTLKNTDVFNDAATRMRGIMRTKQSHVYKLHTIEKIAKEMFGQLLQYTGSNIVIMNISETLDEIDVYDAINDITPVVFTCMLSSTTALVGCLHDEKAKFIAKRCNNCVMMDKTKLHGSIKTLPRIKCLYIKTKQILRQQSFDWSTKTNKVNYYNSAMNTNVSLCDVIEYSSMMKARE